VYWCLIFQRGGITLASLTGMLQELENGQKPNSLKSKELRELKYNACGETACELYRDLGEMSVLAST